jgi:hypothetical protein
MKLPYQKSPCKDCPFRKDVLRGWLGAERMSGLLEQSSFVCHKRTDLQCAGHMIVKGQKNEFVRLASRLQLPLPLFGKHLVFDTEAACIDHHK